MEDAIIRLAKKSDYEPLKGLVKELYETLDVKDGMDDELTQHKFEDILDENKIDVLVADVNDVVVGYLTLNFNKALLDLGSTAIIDELIVSKAYRGKGIGKKLIDTAVKKSKYLGCSEIGVGTEFGNSYAREFYKACGFEEVGVIFEKVLR